VGAREFFDAVSAALQEPLLFREASAAPEVSELEIGAFIAYLDGRAGWTLRRQIEADLGWNERQCRAIASASRPRVVSYPGSPGYQLWERCTVEEIDRCLSSFRAIRVEADHTYLIYLRAYHARGHGGA
jgi:hypothetical protein